MGAAFNSSEVHACNCVGPQNGQPLCPCQMRGVSARDGQYVVPERILGPARLERKKVAYTQGCVCPAGAEATCQGPLCPRKRIGQSASA